MNPTARMSVSAVSVLAALALASPGAAGAQTSLFQVENANDLEVLDLTDEAGFVVRGAFEVGSIPAQGSGVRLMWYPGKAAFRAGAIDADEWDDASIGRWSVAFGRSTTASGMHSVAMNGETTASGDRSVAMGGSTAATGQAAFAMGLGTTASGYASTALGVNSVASGTQSLASGLAAFATGDRSTSLGTNTVAAGIGSIALGSAVTAEGNGSFVFGDGSTNFHVRAASNTFMVRAFGGILFNTGVNIGCDLPAGTGAWACTSSRLAKEGFEDVDGEMVLAKLAGIRIQRWRYIGTGATHVGPTAEDFRSAFGLGEGSTKIAAVDADGIALRAAQALERRTAALSEANAALRDRVRALEAVVTRMALRSVTGP